MAKTRALTRSPVIVALPSPRGLARRGPRRVSRGSRRGFRRKGRGKGSGGISATLSVPVAIGGAAVGWAGAKGYLAKLPMIAGSRMTTLGLAGWAAMRFTRNKYLRAAGLAAIAAAAFDFGRVQGGGAALLGQDIDGDAYSEGDDVMGEVDY